MRKPTKKLKKKKKPNKVGSQILNSTENLKRNIKPYF